MLNPVWLKHGVLKLDWRIKSATLILLSVLLIALILMPTSLLTREQLLPLIFYFFLFFVGNHLFY